MGWNPGNLRRKRHFRSTTTVCKPETASSVKPSAQASTDCPVTGARDAPYTAGHPNCGNYLYVLSRARLRRAPKQAGPGRARHMNARPAKRSDRPPRAGHPLARKDHRQGRTSSLRCGRSTLTLIFHRKTRLLIRRFGQVRRAAGARQLPKRRCQRASRPGVCRQCSNERRRKSK
jgi:hypothetical protein